MTREELLAKIEDPPSSPAEIVALSEAIGAYLEEHPDDVEVALEAEIVDLLISAIERGSI
jgi:hypothetical protein